MQIYALHSLDLAPSGSSPILLAPTNICFLDSAAPLAYIFFSFLPQ